MEPETPIQLRRIGRIGSVNHRVLPLGTSLEKSEIRDGDVLTAILADDIKGIHDILDESPKRHKLPYLLAQQRLD